MVFANVIYETILSFPLVLKRVLIPAVIWIKPFKVWAFLMSHSIIKTIHLFGVFIASICPLSAFHSLPPPPPPPSQKQQQQTKNWHLQQQSFLLVSDTRLMWCTVPRSTHHQGLRRSRVWVQVPPPHTGLALPSTPRAGTPPHPMSGWKTCCPRARLTAMKQVYKMWKYKISLHYYQGRPYFLALWLILVSF